MHPWLDTMRLLRHPGAVSKRMPTRAFGFGVVKSADTRPASAGEPADWLDGSRGRLSGGAGEGRDGMATADWCFDNLTSRRSPQRALLMP